MALKTQYPGIFAWDVHAHMARQVPKPGPSNVFTQWIDLLRPAILAECGVDVAGYTDLDGGWLDPGWHANAQKGIPFVAQHGRGRILATLGDYRPGGVGLVAVRPDQIEAMKEGGACGYKLHWNSKFNGGTRAKHCLINNPHFAPFFKEMERVGLPLWALHLEAPCGNYWAQHDALCEVLETYPKLIVMRAHLGHNRQLTIAQLSEMFKKYPNYYYDTSASLSHYTVWKDYTYDGFREFVLAHSDRLLFGTDSMGDRRSGKIAVARLALKYARQLEWWETDNVLEMPPPKFGAPKGATSIKTKGMALPREALENIYWRNAVRLFPEVRAALVKLGYDVGTVKPEPGDRKTPRAERVLRLTRPGVLTAEDLGSYSAAEAKTLRTQLEALAAAVTARHP
jgi:predicted TIM-barrel fold metal-dependent hydrolase